MLEGVTASKLRVSSSHSVLSTHSDVCGGRYNLYMETCSSGCHEECVTYSFCTQAGEQHQYCSMLFYHTLSNIVVSVKILNIHQTHVCMYMYNLGHVDCPAKDIAQLLFC